MELEKSKMDLVSGTATLTLAAVAVGTATIKTVGKAIETLSKK